MSIRKVEYPRRRIDIRLHVDPDDEHRLKGDATGEAHVRTTYFIARRFADLVGDMTEAGDPDADIVVAAQDVAVNVLQIALQAVIARHQVPYDKAQRLVASVMGDVMPALEERLRWRMQAWIAASEALAKARG